MNLAKRILRNCVFACPTVGAISVPAHAQDFCWSAGSNALSSNTYGDYDTAIGYSALLNNAPAGTTDTSSGVSGIFGDHNTALGANALRNNTQGSQNTALGS